MLDTLKSLTSWRRCEITVGGSILAEERTGKKRRMIHAEKLHASLALLPVDASQVDYLFKRLLKATPSELPVLRDALKPHQIDPGPEALVRRLIQPIQAT